MELIIFLFSLGLVNSHIDIITNAPDTALDQSLYEEALDAEQCDAQIGYIRKNSMLQIQFADAGIRTPRGIATGNINDLGNYHECLGINHATENSVIQGKYCTIRVPLRQSFELPRQQDTSGWSNFEPSSLRLSEDTIDRIEEYNLLRAKMSAFMGMWDGDTFRSIEINPQSNTVFRLAVCIPKSCSTEQAITSLLFNITAIGFRYTDDFCRLPDDKPWVAADTVAVVIFSTIGLLTVLCTSYDLIYTFILKKDPRMANTLYRSFSVFTNGHRLMTFSSGPGTLQCLDGIRSLAMIWVILGHSFSTEVFIQNSFDIFMWLTTLKALMVTSTPITVDTFFTLAGILIVYTTVGKMNGVQLMKKLHLFYLNRLLRMFPILAAGVLLQASFFNRMSDGPFWSTVVRQTNLCRSQWWITLLHLQNYINTRNMCYSQSWYIAIDVQLYILSPLVLFWVLGGKRKTAWIALIAGLLAALAAGTTYSFMNNFQSGTFVPSRPDGMDFMVYYYFNTLNRASPFMVGMIFGYILHIYRGKKLHIPWPTVAILWLCSASVLTTIYFYTYFVKQYDWDNQFVDNFMNSFMRPSWALGLGLMIVACVHGYGGPVNWFLSHEIWRLPARISYAMFVFHYQLMFIINGSALKPVYFSVPRFIFKFLSHLVVSIVVGYLVTLLIDAPFATLFKQLLDGKPKKPQKPIVDSGKAKDEFQEIERNNNESNDIHSQEANGKKYHTIEAQIDTNSVIQDDLRHSKNTSDGSKNGTGNGTELSTSHNTYNDTK